VKSVDASATAAAPVFVRGHVLLARSTELTEPALASLLPPALHGGKERRQLSRAALLATAAALGCIRAADGTRAALPLFVACPSGHEVMTPLLQAWAELEAQGLSRGRGAALFAHAGSNVLDFLKYSTGTIVGHVARYAGLHGTNVCLTGTGASALALRRAYRLLRARRIEEAVVVCGESQRELESDDASGAGGDDDGPREVACGVHLSTKANASDAPRLVMETEANGLPRCRATYDQFEAANALANFTWALSQPDGRGRAHAVAG
jgi:hypothetical protein